MASPGVADQGLDLLLAPLGRETFFHRYWERHPLVLRATPERRAFFAVERDDADVLRPPPPPPPPPPGASSSPSASGGGARPQQQQQPREYTAACDFAELVRRARDPSLPPLRWGMDVNAARAVPRRGGREVERQTPNPRPASGGGGGEDDDADGPATATPDDLWRLFAPPPAAAAAGPSSAPAASSLPSSDADAGYPCSFQLMQPQRYCDALWRLAAALEAQFGALVGINSYITPPGAQGLAPHWDDVEVLVVQTRGAKTWHLRGVGKNAHSFFDEENNPGDGNYLRPSTPSGDLPLAEALKMGRFDAEALFAPRYLRRERAEAEAEAAGAGADGGADPLRGPVTTVTLYPGDVLYMPRGTVHWAEAADAEVSRGTARGEWRGRGGAGGGGGPGGGGSKKKSSGGGKSARERALCHSAHLTISTYQRWSVGDVIMYMLDGALHRPAGAAPRPPAEGGLPIELRRSPAAGFTLACGLEAGTGSINHQLASATTTVAEAMRHVGRRHVAAAGRRMAAADFWPWRLPPHPAQLWPRGPAPELGSRVAWRALRWATVMPVGEEGAGGPVKVVSCLQNVRESHMVPPAAGQEGSDEGDEDEEDDEDDEDDGSGGASGSQSAGGSSSSSGDGSDEEDDDEDDDDDDDDDGSARPDPSDPISALPGVVLPKRLLPGLRQMIAKAGGGGDAAASGQRQATSVDAWRPGGGASLADAAAVPVRELEGAADDGERLRLAYSLWCAGLVSVLGDEEAKPPKVKKEAKKEVKKEAKVKKTELKSRGPVVGKRAPVAGAATSKTAAASKKIKRER